MLRQALILAAGRGRPVATPDVPNCLAEVAGVPLIQRTLRVLKSAGIRRVALTLGFHAELVRRRVEEILASDPNVPVELAFFDNPDWEGPNGLSVLAARRFVDEPTLLVMADQIAAPRLVARFARMAPRGEATRLGVDQELARVFDLTDATKVKLAVAAPGSAPELAGTTWVRGMSKELTDFEAVSASIFVMAPSLLAALDGLPMPSLTEGVAEAARRGLVEAIDVEGALWQDVDSAEMRLHAEWLLRAYGEELDRPAVREARGEARTGATDTLALIERLLGEKDTPRYTLFNPGPVMTSARVKAALVHHDVCHRDEDYTGVVRRLEANLRPVFGASPEHDVMLVTGSGTAAMEISIASVVPAGRRVLTVQNGFFGERLGEIATQHGVAAPPLRVPWGEPIDPAAVAAALDANPDVAAVALIHHETSVGVLNPVAAIGKVCRARGVLLVVDAVSSLGAEDIQVERDLIDVCFASANKCLHGVAGVSFVCVGPRAWPAIEQTAPRVYYLDLRRYRRAHAELGQTPFTPAVSAFFALETALDELREQGGALARREVYRTRNWKIRRVLTDLGFHSFTNTGRESSTISTMRVPPFVRVDDLYDRLKERGFVIYKAKGRLAADHIQVANMGEIPDAALDAFLEAITELVEAARAAELASRPRLQTV